MFDSQRWLAFTLFVSVVVCLTLFFLALRHQAFRKKKKEEDDALIQKNEDGGFSQRDINTVLLVFGVDLHRIDEPDVQDEIVNCVNVLAIRTAKAMVNQKKIARGEKADDFPKGSSWKKQVQELKGEWRIKKDTALRIVPELEARLLDTDIFVDLENSCSEEHSPSLSD